MNRPSEKFYGKQLVQEYEDLLNYCKADGGAASVTWDTENKSWVFAEGFGVGTVFAADPAPASILMAKGIPNQTKD